MSKSKRIKQEKKATENSFFVVETEHLYSLKGWRRFIVRMAIRIINKNAPKNRGYLVFPKESLTNKSRIIIP